MRLRSVLTRLGCVLLVGFACFLTSGSQAQDSILTRQSDEVARTRAERQHALVVLLDAARRSRDAEPAKAAGFLNRAARLQIRLNTSQAALITYREALALLDRSSDTATRIETLNGIAALYLQFSKCEEAVKLVDQIVVLSRQNGSVTGEAEALLTLGDCQSLENQKLAMQTVERSLQMWQSISDKKGSARAYGLLSDLQIVDNNLGDAVKSNEAALSIWRELNLPDEQAGILINLGFIEYRKGAWQECISFLTQAQGLLVEDSEPFRMGQINAGIAEAFMESGIPEAGLTNAKRAVEYYRRAEDPRGVVSTSWDVGKAYYLLRDYPAALAQLQQTAKEADAIGVQRIVAFCHDFMGRTYAAIGENERAAQEYQKALSLYTQLQNPREVARTRVLIGNIYAKRGETDKARNEFQQAIKAFDHLADAVNQSAALHALGKLELAQYNLDVAEDYLKRTVGVTDNIRRLTTTTDLMTAVSATVHDRYESYIECLMRQHDRQPGQGFAVRAFEVSEEARARSLAELLRATQTNLVAGLDPELSEREKSLRQSLHAQENQRLKLLGQADKAEELNDVQTELASVEAQYTQVREQIRAQYPAYDQITRSTAMSLDEIRSYVLHDDKNLLLEYGLADESSYLWVVSRTEFSSFRLPGRSEIDKSTEDIYALLSVMPSVPTEDAERKLWSAILALSKMLLGPAAEKLGDKRLIIVADGALQSIPFQVLVSPSVLANNSDGVTAGKDIRPLVLDHEVVNQPSASTLALLLRESAKRKRATGSVAILADPVFEADDPRIAQHRQPGSQTPTALSHASAIRRDFEQSNNGYIPRLLASREEADAIIRVVPSNTGFKALGFEANRATVATAALSQHGIIHFATHAKVSNKRPESSGIVLSLFNAQGEPQNGYLRMSDIYGLKLPVDLVVLSACQTAVGQHVRGEGLIGLTRGFMYAGASGVTASLWKVDDDATAELMKRFYEGMFRDSLTPAAALRQAQIAMWQQKRWRAPYYWAGFIIQGRYDQTPNAALTSARAQWLVTSGGILSALLLAACLFLRRRRTRFV